MDTSICMTCILRARRTDSVSPISTTSSYTATPTTSTSSSPNACPTSPAPQWQTASSYVLHRDRHRYASQQPGRLSCVSYTSRPKPMPRQSRGTHRRICRWRGIGGGLLASVSSLRLLRDRDRQKDAGGSCGCFACGELGNSVMRGFEKTEEKG